MKQQKYLRYFWVCFKLILVQLYFDYFAKYVNGVSLLFLGFKHPTFIKLERHPIKADSLVYQLDIPTCNPDGCKYAVLDKISKFNNYPDASGKGEIENLDLNQLYQFVGKAHCKDKTIGSTAFEKIIGNSL